MFVITIRDSLIVSNMIREIQIFVFNVIMILSGMVRAVNIVKNQYIIVKNVVTMEQNALNAWMIGI